MTKNKIDKSINYLIVLYAFLLPISRAGIVALTALIFILWLFKPTLKEDIKFLSESKFIIVLILFIVYSFSTLMWSSNYEEGIHYAIRYWYYLPILVIASTLKNEYLHLVISAFLLSMVISEVLSYGMYFNLIDIKNHATPYPTPFMHHIQYSVFIVFTALFLLNKIYYTQNLKSKILYTLFFTTVTMNIFINGGRTGYIIFFVSMSLVTFLNIQHKVKAIFITLLIAISSLYLAYNFSTTFNERINDSITEIQVINNNKYDTSLGQRIGLYYLGSEIIYKNPIIGTGIGDAMDVLNQSIEKNYPQFSSIKGISHFHNVLLQTTVQLGIIGLILQILIFYYFYKISLKDKFYINIKYIFISVFILASFSGNMFHQQFTMAIFSLISGILLAKSRLQKTLNK